MHFLFMKLADDGTLLFQDRGKLEFIKLTTDGELIACYPIDISNQYYSQSVKWKKGNSIGLNQNSLSPRVNPPPIERSLFYVYDSGFQKLKSSFFLFKDLGYSENEMFIWCSFGFFAGSFDLLENQVKIIYSPGVYTGYLYEFTYSGTVNGN